MGGGEVKKGQKSVNVVCEQPLWMTLKLDERLFQKPQKSDLQQFEHD